MQASIPQMSEISCTAGIWKNRVVFVRHCFKKSIFRHYRLLKDGEWAMKNDHDNVLKVLGATIQIDHVAVVYSKAGRGTLAVNFSSHQFVLPIRVALELL